MSSGVEHLDLIREKATEFRAAIVACDMNLLPCSFEYFPQGSCGAATEFLGKYLTGQGLGTFRYVAGERSLGQGRIPTHAWLEQDGLIIDITASQFRGINTPILITRDRIWHSVFTVKTNRVADGDFSAYLMAGEMYRGYEAVCKLIP